MLGPSPGFWWMLAILGEAGLLDTLLQLCVHLHMVFPLGVSFSVSRFPFAMALECSLSKLCKETRLLSPNPELSHVWPNLAAKDAGKCHPLPVNLRHMLKRKKTAVNAGQTDSDLCLAGSGIL